MISAAEEGESYAREGKSYLNVRIWAVIGTIDSFERTLELFGLQGMQRVVINVGAWVEEIKLHRKKLRMGLHLLLKWPVSKIPLLRASVLTYMDIIPLSRKNTAAEFPKL